MSGDQVTGAPRPESQSGLEEARFRLRRQASEIDALRVRMLEMAEELRAAHERAAEAAGAAADHSRAAAIAELRESLRQRDLELEAFRRFRESNAYRLVMAYYGLFEKPVVGGILRRLRRFLRPVRRVLRGGRP